MPKLMDDTMEVVQVAGSNYHFSATRITQDILGSSLFSLVSVVFDISSSVIAFEAGLKKCLKEIAKSCKRNPRVENLMLRLLAFNSSLTEIHGFKLLKAIDPDDYDNLIHIGGCTALYDATHSAIQATCDYGKRLMTNDYMTNAIIFIMTDGVDNESRSTPKMIKEEIEKAMRGECLESITVVLIGVNIKDSEVQTCLQKFQQEAGITQYVDLDNADEKTLARLAHFIDQYISSTSIALNTGGPSKMLTF